MKSWNYGIFKENRDGFLGTSLPSSCWVDVFMIPQNKVEKVMTVLSTGKTYE
ncbi:MAG: hypothetical protein AAF063_21345 [Cyanobacteria bacterium J06643_5]